MTGAGVVIPVRAFALGKARLAARLDDATRTELARKLADRVGAARVSSRRWSSRARRRCATGHDRAGSTSSTTPARSTTPPPRGEVGRQARGCARAVIAHADLPLARALAPLGTRRRPADRGARAVPPRRRHAGAVGAGRRPVPVRLRTRARSAATPPRPGASASAVRVVRDPDLAFDVDVPDDLAPRREPWPLSA